MLYVFDRETFEYRECFRVQPLEKQLFAWGVSCRCKHNLWWHLYYVCIRKIQVDIDDDTNAAILGNGRSDNQQKYVAGMAK